MKRRLSILSLFFSLCALLNTLAAQQGPGKLQFDFYGDPVSLDTDASMIIPFDSTLSIEAIQNFYTAASASHYQSFVQQLLACKEKYQLDDWLYYQLIRKTAQQLSPKAANYYRYTLYKWFLLNMSGYDATLSICDKQLLFYVQSDEEIYNLPYHTKNGKQYICLNYHDYGANIDFSSLHFSEVPVYFANSHKSFSYKVTQLPVFSQAAYQEKDIRFSYSQNEYHFKVKLNPEVQTLFANYPVVDYSYYFNIPMSRQTYQSLIPSLKETLNGMTEKEGIDFLMHFTRYAFLFEPDSKTFGSEKRMSPEETLLYSKSDCEDRAALFFFLVKEFYNLPMVVLVYPNHVTIAVSFDKPVGSTIVYKGKKYSVCEPSPQRLDLRIGQLLPSLKKEAYEIAYEYNPGTK
ncbi:MAG: hypothetical protein U0U70_03165 [Chitinophagaceae bacterium]